MDIKNLTDLAKATANAKSNSQVAYSFGDEKLSYSDLNETLRNELKQLASTYQLYRENKNTIFTLMENVIDDVLPKKVMAQYGQFAEIKQYAQGEKPIFTQRITAASKRRAKKFITKVGLAGVYEIFKLDGATYEIPTEAFGGAAQIAFEEFLDGRVDFADLLDIVMEGLDERIYEEIAKSLIAATDELQAANKATVNGFNESTMDSLISVADSYGKATIYCTYEFAAKMVPADARMSDAQKDALWNNGYLGNYKGHNVIVLEQSYTDETNSEKVINPAYAYIIPTGTDKPVKIAFEGPSAVKDIDSNEDWSKEYRIYKKLGVGTIITNNICVYKDESLDASI